jgi:hypothetical protein
MFQLVMDDQGTRVIIDYFATEEAAYATLALINSIKYESPPMEPNVKFRCFKIGDKRFIDQSAVYTVEEVTVREAELAITPMSLKEYLAEEDAATKKEQPEGEPDLSDLC